MKVIILAGGLGTRITEESALKPKPMIEIGGRPILWHIMKIYSHYGFNDFVVCLGYRGYVIKEYFSNYFLHMSDVTFHMQENRMEVHRKNAEPWRVTLVDTGPDTNTGGRLRRVEEYVKDDPYFAMTYGDGVSDVNIGALKAFHEKHGKLATVTAVRPPNRFGIISTDKTNRVTSFQEKPIDEGGWINGGFFMLSPKVIDLIESDGTAWEKQPMEKLVQQEQLQSFIHNGFWQPMDTMRDKNFLEEQWEKKQAKWKVWA
jgi:glucose-1-phosphate cytidylyltransferase